MQLYMQLLFYLALIFKLVNMSKEGERGRLGQKGDFGLLRGRNAKEGVEVKKSESPSKRGRLDSYVHDFITLLLELQQILFSVSVVIGGMTSLMAQAGC